MWKFLLSINKKLIWAIPVMMGLGFLFGRSVNQDVVKSLKSLIMPLTFLMVYPMMVTLNIKHLKDGIKNVKLQVLTQVINFCVVPFLAYGLGIYFFPENHYLALGLLLASLLPTSGMTISWTGFAKGNMGAAINMTVIGLTLGSLATPLYVKMLMGTKVDMNMMLVVKQIVYIVFIPMVLGYLTRSYFLKKYGQQEFKKTWAPRFPSLSTVGVLGIVFVAIALKAQQLSQDPAILWRILQPLLLLYAANFTIGTIAGRLLFSRGDAIALVYGTVMRNLSIALAISINAFGSHGADAALVIAVSYIIQVQAAAWYVKFTDVFFGPVPVEQ
ncbi:MAG: bile acid:sodium symporter [Desulfocapsaceae bacterium]|nr:bile acid:sodium symporter [Desulfocapsaceae bacterium]